MLAVGWIDPSSPTPEWDAAQVRRLARRLGFRLRWADPTSVLGLAEQVESAGVDAVLLPSTGHVDALTLDRIMAVADVECATPRESFPRWSPIARVRR
ncbi:hypothetical protein [Nocardia farcinica]|uniref:Uncharacterized protein n=1 Tax=Nocardia farcinica TaxID=37329 RepID=A0A0H5P345_NOCFR|nr:hypothetical protein [Nocardia farcinica]AXK87439.1 hypothetical protein DXT66_19020 [Nocardia farcinica]PFX02772.1 hypothetical protein CJ469_02289 [Nocardia farcinica]PFX08394.1 hypothetical protein CJ468_02571 [Nocardia farcinica]CRY81724.1 Uncharacterised protein [Nocardia farcinica]SIT30673.1 hypothetical protein SAMN05421776_109215 [Nocardia farcinica]